MTLTADEAAAGRAAEERLRDAVRRATSEFRVALAELDSAVEAFRAALGRAESSGAAAEDAGERLRRVLGAEPGTLGLVVRLRSVQGALARGVFVAPSQHFADDLVSLDKLGTGENEHG